MEKLKSAVVILEDDTSLAAAMKTAFEREGFYVLTASRSEEVTNYLSKYPVAGLFVDCLLPGGSGVDFVASIRSRYPASVLDVVLMSGLFTDAGFVKDALRTTQAVAFLKKPFDIKEALSQVKKPMELSSAAEVATSPRKELYQLFSKPTVTVREKRKAIEALEEIHGFDLPYLYSLLAETKSSGHLNIISSKGDISGISFASGHIVGVDIADEETYLGKLLIEAGFIESAELDQALSSNSSNKRIGEKLIQANVLSPHAFQIALENQMTIRLSRTIVDAPVKINFVPADVNLSEPSIDTDALSKFLHDWIASKINLKWLKTHYTPWGNYKLAKSVNYSESHPVFSMPLIQKSKEFIAALAKSPTLNEVLDSNKFPEETSYKALHLLLAKGLFIFSERVKMEDDTERIRALKRIISQLHGKNKLDVFELMARMTGTPESQPEMVLTEFKKMIGADTASENKEITKHHQQLTTIAQAAYDFSKSGNKERLREEIAKGELEMKMKMASQYEEAKNLLQKSQFREAQVLLTNILTADSNAEKIKLYLIWCKLGLCPENPAQKSQVLKDIELDLMQIPPEEKFDFLYHFIQGLYYKTKGDRSMAFKSIEKSIHLDSTFIPARRELAVLQSATAQKKDVLNRDLKDLVSGFFKKR